MDLRRLVAAALWLVTTMAATALVWTATSVVARDVTDRPAPVVGHRDVVIALATGPPEPATTVPVFTTTTMPAPAGAHPTTTKVPTPPSTIAPSHAPKTTPIPLGLPASPPTTVGPVPTTAAGRPVVTTVPPPSQATATYSNGGGVITVACTGMWTIRLVSASPSDGYQVDPNRIDGPFTVEVHFLGPVYRSIKASCFFGQPFRTDGQPPTGP